ncbi:MAG: hypothetical protein HW414_1448 [Dehalococcoidia bacterium]|nr:hypothetical protein [Dehalococcoidia bacterium]
MAKTPAELYRERTRRVEDAIQLKVPDRVPLVVSFGLFPAKYAGITCQDAYYDSEKWGAAVKKTLLDFKPDMYHGSAIVSGAVLGHLGCTQVKWPGDGVSPHHTHQFVEGEYMKADEYDAFFEDPSDWVVRTYMPRIYKNLGPLKSLPRLSSMVFGYGQAMQVGALAAPDVAGALDALVKAGLAARDWQAAHNSLHKEIIELGFPLVSGPSTNAPFDMVTDYLRGMRGTMLDMYRQPEKLIKACEMLLPLLIERGVSGARRSGNPRVFIPTHRGSDGFMSLKQFEIFYWPTFKKLMMAFIDEGLTPCPFLEGDWTQRLEILLELPKGKVLGHFDRTDMKRAKEVLVGHMCIRGNVPSSLLQTRSPQEVIDYCKQLIDVVGKGGGFIMAPGCVVDEAKPENIRAMIDFTKEYGVYH